MHTKFWSENLKGRFLGRTWRRREDNNRMDLKEIGWECVEWIRQAQDRVHWWAIVNFVMNFCDP
jgi:hypothetical protein